MRLLHMINRYFLLITIVVLFQFGCTNQTVSNTSNPVIRTKNSLDLFSYYDESNNVQLTALLSGTFTMKNGCLLFGDEDGYITPVFNTKATNIKVDLDSKTVILNAIAVPFDTEAFAGGGFIDKKNLPELQTTGDEKCLTDRVATIHSIEVLTPELRRKFLLDWDDKPKL